MTKYYNGTEFIVKSIRDDYQYMVTNNLLNCGTHRSFHKDLESAEKAHARALKEIQANIDYCKERDLAGSAEYYENLLLECKIVKLIREA